MRISFRTVAVGAVAIATLSIVVQPAAAAVATGYLDHTFSDGKVLTNVAGDDTGAAVAVQPDRKVVVAGTTHGGTDIAVVRYNTDGALDPSFDGDGIVITDLSGDDAAFAVAIRADGKIVVGGFTDDGVSAALLRYDADGTLDTTLGGGDGVATISAGTGAVFVGSGIQSDDSIVATRWGTSRGSSAGSPWWLDSTRVACRTRPSVAVTGSRRRRSGSAGSWAPSVFSPTARSSSWVLH